MITQRVSVRYIAEKVYRDLRVNTELPIFDIIEWVSEALLFIGAFDQFESVTGKLEVEDYKVKLPCGFYKLQTITYNNAFIKYAGNSLPTTLVTGTFRPNDKSCLDSYYINNGCITTSFKTGTLCITYLSIPVDSEGYPTVPDDVYFLKACTAYVTKMLDYQDWRAGRIADKVFQKSEDDWDWYCAAARGASNLPDSARMELLKNTLVRLIPEQNRHLYFMHNNRESRKLH
jgi:hypothetical protein